MQLHQCAALSKRLLPTIALTAATVFVAPCAHAKRPFDGTDAAVAAEGMFELELGGGYLRQPGGNIRTLPFSVFNFGLGADTELVAEGRVQTNPDASQARYRTGLNDAQISVKHVLRKGSLQEGGSGVSLAVECSALLPGYRGESGTGGECAAIASQAFEWGAVHLNVASERDREHQWGQFHSVIIEGPEDWTVRPMVELTHEHTAGEPSAVGKLLGVAWKIAEELELDAAVRRLHRDGAQLTELRFGLTWGFKLGH